MSPPSPHGYDVDHDIGSPSPSPAPPLSAQKDSECTQPKRFKSPVRKMSPLPKVPKYDLHEKKDDYTRALAKVIDEKKAEKAKEKDIAGTSKSSASRSAAENKSTATSAPLKAKPTTKGKKRKEVPLLGAQPKQSIPALKVFNVPKLYQQQGGFDMEEAAKLAAACDVTVEELMSAADIVPTADMVPQFVYGADLVSKEQLHKLPTHMRNLHQWYLDACKENIRFIVAHIPREYYYRKEEIHIEINELWQLFNLDALDKSLMSCYCLLKISECKSHNIINIGFVDPDKVNVQTVKYNKEETGETYSVYLHIKNDPTQIVIGLIQNGVFFSFVSTHSTITIVSEHWIVVIILFFFVIFHYNPSCFSGTDLIDDIKPNAFCRQIASAEQKQSIRPDAEHSSGQNNIIQHAHSHNFKYIDAIKSALESVCTATVSCTDLLALAARDGVTMLGGPADIPMRTGRRDATVSYYGEMERYLPVHNDTVSAVLSRFAPMGVDAVGVVALLGAHSVGRVHCFNLVVRLYPAVDGTIEPAYGAYLRERCPTADAVEDTRDVAYANPTKEIFSELDEINAQGLIFPRSFQKTERETKWGDEAPTQQGGAAQALAARPWRVGPSRRP
ncbi:hypothetical protein QYE76_038520 [Lolium multiflorum]|uniref:Plant heme peroxidase family profile domain-containing protein n=1 Tax=Lolium multiflorum TaxID=4521 RepID=A0AAD8WR06_LOLMU|nr:hypothetical protein QYE76_038520 [Lolium multiflorum]